MVYQSICSRFALVVLATMLLIPVVGIHTQSRQALEQFHNRTLSPPPPGKLLWRDPARYFKERKAWLADRIYPITKVTYWHKKALYHWFATAPEPRVTLGRDEFVFLNGGSNSRVNELFESACITSHDKKLVQDIKNGLEQINTSPPSTHPIDAIVIPTLATVYPEHLPGSVPLRIRQACYSIAQGASPLLGNNAPGDAHLLYPLVEMRNKRTDAAFYPRANWHAQGLSLITARNEYLKHVGITARPEDERLTLTQTSSEILGTYDITELQPQYVISNNNVTENLDYKTKILSALSAAGGQAHDLAVLDNQKPALKQRTLIFSDSFGIAAAPVMAGVFMQTIRINTNNMDNRQIGLIASRLRKENKIDRTILLVQEGNTPRLLEWVTSILQYTKPTLQD